MEIYKQIAEELNIKASQAKAAIELIDEGNTIPFIARYRKEVTGSLDDEQLRKLFERLNYLRNLEEKKAQVINSINEQGKLTKELEVKIKEAKTLVLVEDLYRPYRPKRRTRAIIAKEKGLEPLASSILEQAIDFDLSEFAKQFIDLEKEVNSSEEAINGAMDIIAEEISDNAEYREYIRSFSIKDGVLSSSAKDKDETSVYEMYYNFEEKISSIAGHRILAINRGEKEKLLLVKLIIDEEKIINYLQKKIITKDNTYTNNTLILAIEDAYKRLIAPSIEREIRNDLTERAEDGAISVFGKNLVQLLMQPPITNKTVLGWDPAFRTGCKLAVVDSLGKVLDTTVIFPTEPQKKIEESKRTVKNLIKKHNINLIALGNGTASRESEVVIVELLKEIDEDVKYIIVNEAGASVYSASKLATKEFPNFDVGQRSSASIARRLQDPLAELVKIDPKSIGIGQYQHDMNQKKLNEALTGVVENCVNTVGVDLNTASISLLEYVAGINKTVAQNIVNYREENGRYKNRKQLLKVAKLGPKAFEQSAGFLRIIDGDNLLDMTGVHPESYKETKELLSHLDLSFDDVKSGIKIKLSDNEKENIAKEIGIGLITLNDIIKELEKPGRDPRDEMPKPILREDILDIKDLKEGMILKGTVRNVIDFGAFVDIGVHQDGLVHISQLTNKKFVKHPLDIVAIGDIVEVKVMNVDINKKRIQLTMII